MKKGFVLMETIIVIVVISVALLTLFSSYSKILSKVKTENKYDTSEYIYTTYYVKQYLKTKITEEKDIYDCSVDSLPINWYDGQSLGLVNVYNIRYIYLLKNINDITLDKLKNFDAYMIDYIKKLSVDDNETLIIVEYQKEDINNKGKFLTYISSLEW